MGDEYWLFIMAPDSSSKRRRESDSDDDETAQNWPRFLVMQTSRDDDESLQKLSPFAIALGIKGIAGEPKSVRKISQGLLIEVSKRAHAQNLLKTSTFVSIAVTVTAHRTLNFRKGVIRCRDLAGLSEEDICRELHDQHITNVKRIYVERGTKATDTYILTFNATELPPAVKIGYLNVRVSLYIPNPLRCFKCQMYGHGSNHCNGLERCSKCGENHRLEVCTAGKPHCIHCKTEHAASDRNCPKYVLEKLISKVKYTENISFQEARRRVGATQPSYSSVAQAKIHEISPKPKMVSASTQTNYYWPIDKKSPSIDPPAPLHPTTSPVSQTVPDKSSSNSQRQPRSNTSTAGHHSRSNSCGEPMEVTASIQTKGNDGQSKKPPTSPIKYPKR